MCCSDQLNQQALAAIQELTLVPRVFPILKESDHILPRSRTDVFPSLSREGVGMGGAKRATAVIVARRPPRAAAIPTPSPSLKDQGGEFYAST